MKRLLKYIFIPVLAILLMSHNVFAVDMSPNVHPIWANANPLCSFHHKASNTWGNNAFSNNSTGTTATYSFDLVNCDYPAGLNTVKTYAVYSFRFDNFAYDNSADSGWLASKIRSISGSANWGVIGQEVSATGATGWQLDLYLYSTAASNGGTFQIYNPLNADEIFYLKPQERITFLGASYWQVTTDTDLEYNYTDLITAIRDKLTTANNWLYDIRSIGVTVRDSVNGISQKLDNMAQDTADAINDGQADATQGASDNSSTAADNNSTNQTTSNLLGVFGSFVTAITSISPSNCNVDFDLGHIDFGMQNLCSQPVPQAFTVVTSIVVVCFTIPFVVHLIRRILSLIREMQT